MVRSEKSDFDYMKIDDKKDNLPPLSVENYALTEKALRKKQKEIQKIGETVNQMMIQELGSSFCRKAVQNFIMPKGIFATIMEDISDIIRNITNLNRKKYF